MGEKTTISWTEHSFNPWIGCTKVSPGCLNCYAETQDHRWGHDSWGPGKPRRTTTADYWKAAPKWEKAAKAQGRRHRVFCASMADVFDAEAPAGVLDRLYALIVATPNLDWLVLTKRPQRAADYLREHPAPANLWLGTSVEDQKRADERIPILALIPDLTVRFLSVEPMLEPVDLVAGLHRQRILPQVPQVNTGTGEVTLRPAIDWVICGGESGPGARPFEMTWVQPLHEQATSIGAAWFFKQTGEVLARAMNLKDKKGENLAELLLTYSGQDVPPPFLTRAWPA